jgi:hypothetical protein
LTLQQRKLLPLSHQLWNFHCGELTNKIDSSLKLKFSNETLTNANSLSLSWRDNQIYFSETGDSWIFCRKERPLVIAIGGATRSGKGTQSKLLFEYLSKFLSVELIPLDSFFKVKSWKFHNNLVVPRPRPKS